MKLDISKVPAKGHLWSLIGILAVVAFLGITAITSLKISKVQQELREASRYNVTWSASQANNELLKLQERIAAFGLSSIEVSLDEVETRFQVLESRLEMLGSGPFQNFVRDNPKHQEILEHFRAAIDELRPILTRLETSHIPQVYKILGPLQVDMASLASSANRWSGDRIAEDQRELIRLHWLASGLMGGLALCGATLSLLLIGRNRMLRRAHEKLQVAKTSAQAALQVKTDFLAMMSHELRTPLNGIIGFADLLIETDLNDQQKHYAKLVRDSGRSLLVIVNDVLDFSKIEAGRLTLKIKPLDVCHLAESCCRLMEHVAAEKGLALSCELAPGLPAWVVGDKQRLRQILLNLLNNAVKFTEKGSITLVVAKTAEGGPNRIRFAVEDTGIGIPEDKHGLLFERFAQLDSSKTRAFGGTGLGLAISKRLVEMMGGRIGMTSTPGAGSTFWFELPLPETAAPARVGERSPVPITERQSRPARILLAEDLKANQILVTAILKRAGYQVDVAETGEAAVEAVQRQNYDLVLMDVQMPAMDGLEATRLIRALAGTVANIPIVALTASVLEQDVEACRAAGMDDFVAKPVDRDALLAAVERWARPKAEQGAGQPQEAVPAPAVLDAEKLASVEDLVGRKALEELVGSFLSDLGQRLAVITAPGAERQTVEREAHALISLAGNLGLVEVSLCSRKLTDACRRAQEADIPKLIQELSAAAERAQMYSQAHHVT
jgi:signal transduction histidine kinase/DNA-binding response OmpR family regulator